MSEKSNYEKLAAIDVSQHIEKKQNLSYLSWAWAVDQLMRADSSANWVYNEPIRFPDESMMVSCTVTAFGKAMTMHLPVMDFRNKAVKNPDAFAVNTAMMRCLVKAIALHGLGLYIYAGEDLPLAEDNQKVDFNLEMHLDIIKGAGDIDDLRKVFADAMGAANNAKDKDAAKVIIKAKDARKEELAKENQ